MFNFNIMQTVQSSLKTAVIYLFFFLPDNHFSPFAAFTNLLQIFVFSLSQSEVCSGLIVLAVYISRCFFPLTVCLIFTGAKSIKSLATDIFDLHCTILS